MSECLAILDCGGQYTKVIDRKVRELGVKTDILKIGTHAKDLSKYSAIILSGGPSSVYDQDAPKYDEAIFDLNIPILGLCYGMQLLNSHWGGVVSPGIRTEYGQTVIDVDTDCPLFFGLDKTQTVLMNHGDTVTQPAPGFSVCATSSGVIAGVCSVEKRQYGVQFHPEVDLSENGVAMLENFCRRIAGLKEVFSLEDRIQTAIAQIQTQVGENPVMVLVSGGVDSAVSAALLLKALPADRVYAIHIDHGLMRLNESDRICEELLSLGLVHLQRINAQEEFFHTPVSDGERMLVPLSQLLDPEDRRHVIGTLFVRQVERACNVLGLDYNKTYWAQGTLRPDLIESGNPDVSVHASKIKTHHNDVDLVRQAREKGLVVETNRDWHKDEVRKVARMLGLSEEIAMRQPFPGPGLAVRLICTDASDILEDSMKQDFAKVLSDVAPNWRGEIVPVRSVGIQGDFRSFRFLSVVDAGGLDADWQKVSTVAATLPNRLPFTNRVAFVLNKEGLQAPITVSPMYTQENEVELLRQADAIVTKYLGHGKISQAFAVLLPFGTNGKRSIAVRAFVTNDYMTGRAAIIGKEIAVETLKKIRDEILFGFGDVVDLVMYDATDKPPATVEWQ